MPAVERTLAAGRVATFRTEVRSDMANRAYVGNLPFTFTAADLQNLFNPFGTVRSAEIVSDRATGRSRGFGFVEMDTGEALKAAMAGLDGKNVGGRNLTVNEARERAPRPSGPRPAGGFGDRGGAPRPGGDRVGPSRGFGGPPQGGGGRGRGERERASERGERLERYEPGDRNWRQGFDEDES
jgi:RNA recognition motif-containing protein